MRLRQLGTTQSITFIAPPEVHQSIQDVCRKHANSPLDSSDVITWLLEQTCAVNKDLQSLYFSQGINFCYRMQAEITYKDFLTNGNHRKEYMEQLQQPEQQTLEQLYAPRVQEVHDPVSLQNISLPIDGKLCEYIQELKQSYYASRVNKGSVICSALEEVEQEREVAYEIEEERELQRPDLMKAHKFPGLHRAIEIFVRTGLLDNNGDCIKASTVLDLTQLGRKHKIEASCLMSRLYVSPEFLRTIRLKKGEKDDNFTVSF